jgi:serine/threonine protein kinase
VFVIVQCHRRWELGERLDKGGFGEVFLATDQDGNEAAAKLVPKEPGAERELLFVDLGDIRNVVPVIDSGEIESHWVLIMPRATRSLKSEIERVGPMPPDAALGILRDIAAALADLQDRVVHRDLKPGNVLLLNGVWCLADFGISRYAEASTASDTRKFAWSAPYAAPERWREQRATSATDVYSFGVIAYELLTGTLPYPGPDFRDEHLHTEPQRAPGPNRLATLMEECMYKAPEARPTAKNLEARLERAATSPRLPGAAQLGDAYRAQAQRTAEESRVASAARTEQERRAQLADAASLSLDSITNEFREVLDDEAPSAETGSAGRGGWSVTLGNSQLAFSRPVTLHAEKWGNWPAPFHVVCYSTVSVSIPADRAGYTGCSHSLHYCDALEKGAYGWYETAYCVNAFMAPRTSEVPFALNAGSEEAAIALAPGMGQCQVAWPFTKLVPGDVDNFLDRWLKWFATAARGQLGHPASMPEQPVPHVWRTGN